MAIPATNLSAERHLARRFGDAGPAGRALKWHDGVMRHRLQSLFPKFVVSLTLAFTSGGL
jgi:hypothetical protein